jgi:hypothetical protein
MARWLVSMARTSAPARSNSLHTAPPKRPTPITA